MSFTIVTCKCGVKFNPDTTGQQECSFCVNHLSREVKNETYLKRNFLKSSKIKILKPKKYKGYIPPLKNLPRQPTGIIAKTKKTYFKLYLKLPRSRSYRTNWQRKKRQEQRLAYGRALW